MNDPKWVVEAKKHIGQKEIAGPSSNSWIKNMWLSLKGGAWFWKTYGNDDSKLPWCGAFCARVFDALGMKYANNYASAKAWLNWGRKVPVCLGAVAVKSRQGGGHVAFIVGRTRDGYLVGLGGNQGDAVSYARYKPADFEGFRYPDGELPEAYGFDSLPLLTVTGPLGVKEA